MAFKPKLASRLDQGPTNVEALFDKYQPDAAFAEHVAASGLWSRCGRTGAIHRWNGAFHERLEDNAVETEAYGFILAHKPNAATARVARAGRDACVLRLPELPPAIEDRAIVAGLDYWLEILSDGRIVRIAPDQRIGITAALPLSLGGAVGEAYEPQPRPTPGSMFERFLQVVQPDPIAQDLLRDWAGYTLIPFDVLNLEKCLICLGDGGDGKSVSMEIISALHSRKCSIRPDELTGFGLQTITKMPTLICIDEVPESRISTGLWKSLVSGGVIAIDRKNKEQVDVRNVGRVMMCGNKPPRLSEAMGPAFQRRHIYLRFNAALKAEQSEPNLGSKIVRHEMREIVDWALCGAAAIMRRPGNDRFVIPESAKRAMEESLAANDSCYGWTLQAEPVVDPLVVVSKDEVYSDYKAFCDDLGREPLRPENFWSSLRKHLRCGDEALEAGQRRLGKSRARCVHLAFGDRTRGVELGAPHAFD